MVKSRSNAPRTVVKQEREESIVRWIECKALLADIWKDLPAMPSLASRRAWAVAHGVDPILVHEWFHGKKRISMRKGNRHHPEDGYTLALSRAPEGQPSSSTAPALDNACSPSYLPMSSPPPQTPLDMFNDPPVAISSGSLFEEDPAAHPLSLETLYYRLFAPAPSDHSNKVGLAIKNEMVPPPDHETPESGKGHKTIPRVAPDREGSSKRPRRGTGNAKPTAATAKKKRQTKKAPKIESTDDKEDSAPPEKATLDPAGPTMAWPQNFSTGLYIPPYCACFNPAMAFGTGMPTAQNLPHHSFGNIMYNPFTGAPLFNNLPEQFPALPGQPNQPAFFNGNADIGLPGQMVYQFPAPPQPGSSLNGLGNNPTGQNFFAGNFQGFQPDMPAEGATNFHNQPEPTMSLIDFLNAPLDA